MCVIYLTLELYYIVLPKHYKQMSYLFQIRGAYTNKPLAVDDKSLRNLSEEGGLAKEFLTALEIKDTDGKYEATCDNYTELEAAYRVLYALWGDKDIKKEGSCTIL